MCNVKVRISPSAGDIVPKILVLIYSPPMSFMEINKKKKKKKKKKKNSTYVFY